MSRVPDKEAERQTTTGDAVGKVVVDSRGHNVWQWAREVIDSTSVLLKRLENKDLALEPTSKVPVMRDVGPAAKAPKAKPATKSAVQPAASRPALQRERDRGRSGGGFDPYNSR